MSSPVRGPAERLGGLLIDLGTTPGPAARRYLAQLRNRVGPELPVDVRWTGPEDDVPANTRLLRGGPGARVLARAAESAASRGHLGVLLTPLLTDSAVLGGLLDAFGLDEMVGFVAPRFADERGDRVWFLPGAAPGAARSLPRQCLSLLPPHYFTTERLAACLIIRREVAAEIAASEGSLESLPAAVLEATLAARRRGHRMLVLNHVVVPAPDAWDRLYPVLDRASSDELYARWPDANAGEEWFDELPHQRREVLAATARRARPASNLPVLLDCRGVPAFHNGTSEAAIGLLDGIRGIGPSWVIDLAFNADAARFHRIAERYPEMKVEHGIPERAYASAVCLNQPWHVSTVAELHRRGLTIGFNMLDTIAWDVVYLGNPEMAKAWHFVATHGDGLAYISEFTRRRFRFRFPLAPSVLETVTHLSLDVADYRDPALADAPEEDFLLVFGNQYDHKAVAPTVDLLNRAFPFQRIKAFGAPDEERHNVTVLQSGHLSSQEIDRLVASARVVVFPSHYEGFGLPVVRSLAYGRSVVVRACSLWPEIAGLMRMPGRLVQFSAPHELVEAVGKLLAGEPVDALPFGGGLAGEAPPPGWRDCARRLVDLVERMVSGASPERWYARDRALSLART
ncbi:MAG TPA: glycosyltransferase [Myxococcaceae bacterium]|nr:glycosyltransferase [Myxococcaceae bacterium]